MNFSSLDHPSPSEGNPSSRMSLEAYLQFCDELLAFADPERVQAQKEWEEQIEHPFKIEDVSG